MTVNSAQAYQRSATRRTSRTKATRAKSPSGSQSRRGGQTEQVPNNGALVRTHGRCWNGSWRGCVSRADDKMVPKSRADVKGAGQAGSPAARLGSGGV